MAKLPAQGLLITDATVEVLTLHGAGGKYWVASYAWSRLPAGMVNGGKIADSKALAEEIKKVAIAVRPQLKGPVVLGLSQAHVFLKGFTVPKFEGKDLEEAIWWHVNSLSPLIPEDTYTAYEIAGETADGQIRVILAAVQKEIVDTYVEALDLAGVAIGVIEPVVMAKTRLINPKQLWSKSVVSVHVYGGVVTASILVNGKVWFSRESGIAAGNEQVINRIVNEIVDYFVKKRDKDVLNLSEILYCGDRAGLQLIKSNLTNTHLPVVAAEAGIVLKASAAVSDVEVAAFAPVLGLAMRGDLNRKEMVNLVPAWLKVQDETNRWIRATAVILGITAITIWLMAGVWMGFKWWWQQEVVKLSLEQSQVIFDLKEEQELMAWKEGFNRQVTSAAAILEDQTDYGQVLSDLAAVTPKGVRLTALVYQSAPNKWSISGVAASREDVLVFDRELKNAQLFPGARLYFSSLDTDTEVAFRFGGGGGDK